MGNNATDPAADPDANRLLDCESECPPCPQDSLRLKKVFTVQVEHLPTGCTVTFTGDDDKYVQCLDGINIEYGSCEQAVELTVCEDTPSEQTLTCCLRLDYLRISGELELLFNVSGFCDSDCEEEPVLTFFHALKKLSMDEYCYYCSGTRPTIENGNLCDYIEVDIVSVSETGLITFTVEFTGCPQPL